jgi:SAM-dependent methyltransferase
MNAIDAECSPRCVVCGKTAGWKLVTTLPTFLFYRHAEILRCNNCGVGRTIPAPDTTIEYYENNIRNDELFIKRSGIYKCFAEELLKHLIDISPAGGKLLDFGCGGGFIIEAAGRMGYRAEGIEANVAMVDWCQSRGLKVSNKDIDQLVAEDGKYDVVIFSAVLEHILDPYSVLVSCKRLLSPSGILVISQASYDGLLPRILPWGWYGWQPLEHYWHFTPQSLCMLLQRCGLCPIELIRNSLYHPWFKRGTILELAGRNLAALIARIGLKMGMGDNFYYFFKASCETTHSLE